MKWRGPTITIQWNDLTVEDERVISEEKTKHEYLVKKGEQFYLPLNNDFRIRIDDGPEDDVVWVRWWQ